MIGGIICAKCGAKSTDKEFVAPFCIDCYPVNITVPSKVEVDICKKCERMRISNEWMRHSRKKISEYIVKKCKGSFLNGEFEESSSKIIFNIQKGGRIFQISKNIFFNKIPNMCSQCSKISGGYYEAIIQIRGHKENTERLSTRVIEELLKKTFVSKSEEKKEGIDLYVGSTGAAMEWIKHLGRPYVVSRKLFGRKNGKRIYRTTFAIRV